MITSQRREPANAVSSTSSPGPAIAAHAQVAPRIRQTSSPCIRAYVDYAAKGMIEKVETYLREAGIDPASFTARPRAVTRGGRI